MMNEYELYWIQDWYAVYIKTRLYPILIYHPTGILWSKGYHIMDDTLIKFAEKYLEVDLTTHISYGPRPYYADLTKYGTMY